MTMRQIVYNKREKFRDTRKLLDLLDLSKYIAQEFEFYIKLDDLYNVWRDVSIDIFCRDWVHPDNIEYNPDKRTFILFCLDKYCVFLKGEGYVE